MVIDEDFDQSLLTKVSKPMDGYNNEYLEYGAGEIIPGYSLKAKIESIDAMSDSRNCNIQFS
jgi:hypothetical protein